MILCLMQETFYQCINQYSGYTTITYLCFTSSTCSQLVHWEILGLSANLSYCPFLWPGLMVNFLCCPPFCLCCVIFLIGIFYCTVTSCAFVFVPWICWVVATCSSVFRTSKPSKNEQNWVKLWIRCSVETLRLGHWTYFRLWLWIASNREPLTQSILFFDCNTIFFWLVVKIL